MRALLSETPGGPETLVLRDLPDPAPGKGEAVLAVRAVGVNFPDVLIIEDRYQFKPPRPFAPGAECAGVIEAVGEGVAALKPGDRVLALTGWGAMAERIAVAADRCVPIPDEMDFERAAALLMTYGTALYALKDRAGLKAGDRLLVLGAAGGVGQAAVELGKALGAEVVAAASTQGKVDAALALGADRGVVYGRDLDRDGQKALAGQFKQALGGDGADVVIDCVGGAYAEPALRAMAWEGRYLVVGFPAGIPSIPLNLTLLKSIQIVGVFWGAHVAREPDLHADNLSLLFELFGQGRIRPRVTETYPLERGGEAIARLASREAVGKIVVTL
ncbi:NADPH:quinone oxidoreductase family protein [Brevundimonas sp. 2R-24]|uniref:NADPH:quinone oxidoreductase family protein n=1 Tax=Peiella sedimenti TaxID=3061083 RepID=A0ABT8SPM9_9CAUL|nr:NADPH:quinone oxidoreductase family protein [Caulobacteraceae bacterium XZ-24]